MSSSSSFLSRREAVKRLGVIGFSAAAQSWITAAHGAPAFAGVPPLDGTLHVDVETCSAYAQDFGAIVHEQPVAVLKPGSVDDVVKMLVYARQNGIRIVGWALAVLWATGAALVVFETGIDLQALMARPKLVAKILVVCVLTLNGAALHRFAFPRLRAGTEGARLALAFALGAVSTASWLGAAFIGAARRVAPLLGLFDFLVLYALLLAMAVSAALVLYATRPRLSLRLHSSR